MSQRFFSHRQRVKEGICVARLEIASKISVEPDFAWHQCELSTGHYGVHLCWCGSAFNDVGELFTQTPLPGLEASR